MDENQKKLLHVAIAVLVAAIVLVWYVSSGRSSFDTSTRELATQEDIQEVDIRDPQRVTITCKNGEQYQIMFTESQDNYADLIFDNCGEDGAIEE